MPRSQIIVHLIAATVPTKVIALTLKSSQPATQSYLSAGKLCATKTRIFPAKSPYLPASVPCVLVRLPDLTLVYLQALFSSASARESERCYTCLR